MSLRVYYGQALAAYGFPEGHPFGSDRLSAFWNEFVRRGLDQRCQIAPPINCTRAELELFHRGDYVERVQRQCQLGEGFLDQGDTPAFPGGYEAACVVVGSVLDAAKAMLAGDCRQVFIPIAGLHHARRDTAGGFCIFNDIGVLIEWLRARGIRRIGYVDIDAHHGDGVYYSFEDDPDLFFADLHEDGRFLYPGTGAAFERGSGAALGTKLNIPLPPGTDDAGFLTAWPIVEEFLRGHRPEFLILQAGADSIAGDPLTHLHYTPASHRHAAERLRTMAETICGGRLIALGGGGYNRANLAAAWCAVAEGMIGTGPTS